MAEKTDKRKLAILNALRDSDSAISSAKIKEELYGLGYDISERTVRYYLKQMDQDGFTSNFGRRGRGITQKGISELEASRVVERVGFLSVKIDRMTYRMNFDLTTKSGVVVINTTLVDPTDLVNRIDMISRVFENGYAMGHLVGILGPGESAGHVIVPDGMIGFCTVCSITLNGVLLKYGIPTNSRFGGLLELQDKKPVRFVDIITYDGTTIDPLEVFIRSGMTDYVGAITTGNGKIGASFREFPAESRDIVETLADNLRKVGLGAFLCIGRNGRALLDIPVSDGRVGAIVIGGLNPVAILEETGIRVNSRAMAGLVEFHSLFRYEELGSRLRDYL